MTYIRYAESARTNWIQSFAAKDPKNRQKWSELLTPKGDGVILRSIKTDFKFVSGLTLHPLCYVHKHPRSLSH